jgi:hypothetical protein
MEAEVEKSRDTGSGMLHGFREKKGIKTNFGYYMGKTQNTHE